MFSSNPIWQNPAFVKLWLSSTVSSFGGQISNIALALTAVTVLHATPDEMGWLIAMETLPFALLSLPSGVWLDRVRKLPMLVVGEFTLAALLITIPIATWYGWLSLTHLYVVGFGIGVCAVFLGTAFQVFTTHVVGKQNLVPAHSAISASNSASATAGPGIGGTLVQLMTAPMVMLVDAVCLFVAGFLLMRIKVVEPKPEPATESFMAQLREGLRFVFADKRLRALTWSVAFWQILFHSVVTLQVLLASRDLGLSAQALGFAFTAGGSAALVGALLAPKCADRFGVGPVMMAGFALTSAGWVAMAISPSGPYALAAFALSQLLFGLGSTLFFVTYISMRQVLTPAPLLSRVTATMRFLTVAATPIGALLAGKLGAWIGVRSALELVAVASIILTIVVATASPLRAMTMPNSPEPE